MARDNLTKSADIQVAAREVDFLTRFANNWEALRDILGISRPIEKAPGTVLKTTKAYVSLESGSVPEGDLIPYSQASVVEVPFGTITLEKYKKATSAEAIIEKGYDDAVGKTDEAFLFELQNEVTGKFYSFLNGGELTSVQTTFRMALAMAKGLVVNKFKAMHKTATEIVGFANVLDVYEWLGDANNMAISIQSAFGFNYAQDFMGYKTLFLLSDDEIPSGRVIATPVENIVTYYVNPSNNDLQKSGLVFRTAGETSLIGINTQGNYNTDVSETNALMGMSLFAEYIDGIAVVDVIPNGSLGSLTVASAEGEESGTTAITVTEEIGKGSHFAYKTASGTAPTVTYLAKLDSTWTMWDGESDITATDGYKITVAEVNGSGQVVSAGNTTVNSKN